MEQAGELVVRADSRGLRRAECPKARKIPIAIWSFVEPLQNYSERLKTHSQIVFTKGMRPLLTVASIFSEIEKHS